MQSFDQAQRVPSLKTVNLPGLGRGDWMPPFGLPVSANSIFIDKVLRRSLANAALTYLLSLNTDNPLHLNPLIRRTLAEAIPRELKGLIERGGDVHSGFENPLQKFIARYRPSIQPEDTLRVPRKTLMSYHHHCLANGKNIEGFRSLADHPRLKEHIFPMLRELQRDFQACGGQHEEESRLIGSLYERVKPLIGDPRFTFATDDIAPLSFLMYTPSPFREVVQNVILTNQLLGKVSTLGIQNSELAGAFSAYFKTHIFCESHWPRLLKAYESEPLAQQLLGEARENYAALCELRDLAEQHPEETSRIVSTIREYNAMRRHKAFESSRSWALHPLESIDVGHCFTFCLWDLESLVDTGGKGRTTWRKNGLEAVLLEDDPTQAKYYRALIDSDTAYTFSSQSGSLSDDPQTTIETVTWYLNNAPGKLGLIVLDISNFEDTDAGIRVARHLLPLLLESLPKRDEGDEYAPFHLVIWSSSPRLVALAESELAKDLPNKNDQRIKVDFRSKLDPFYLSN